MLSAGLTRQDFSDLGDQTAFGERFLKELDLFIHDPVMGDDVGRIPEFWPTGTTRSTPRTKLDTRSALPGVSLAFIPVPSHERAGWASLATGLEAGHGRPVRIRLYDAAGRELRTLVEGVQAAGDHVVRVPATGLPAGIYFYRLEAGSVVEEHEAILVR